MNIATKLKNLNGNRKEYGYKRTMVIGHFSGEEHAEAAMRALQRKGDITVLSPVKKEKINITTVKATALLEQALEICQRHGTTTEVIGKMTVAEKAAKLGSDFATYARIEEICKDN